MDNSNISLNAVLAAVQAQNPSVANLQIQSPQSAFSALRATSPGGINAHQLEELSRMIARAGATSAMSPGVALAQQFHQGLPDDIRMQLLQQQHQHQQAYGVQEPTNTPSMHLPQPSSDGNSGGEHQGPDPPRRIRRRRPKSPKAYPSPGSVGYPESPEKRARSYSTSSGVQNSPMKVEDEQQMNTPEDPVIHSPNALRLSQNGGNFGRSEMDMMRNGSIDETDCSSEEARRRQKMCRVCGDHATGYNFNVVTCESCKAFFRRNALRPKEFKCPYSDDCEINAVSRRFCQKCRLKKCFDVGMKKEWILNDEQLRRRKNSRLNNLRGHQQGSSSSAYHRSTSSASQQSPASQGPRSVEIKSEFPDAPKPQDFRMRPPFPMHPMGVDASSAGMGMPPQFPGVYSQAGRLSLDMPPQSLLSPSTETQSSITSPRSSVVSPSVNSSGSASPGASNSMHHGERAEDSAFRYDAEYQRPVPRAPNALPPLPSSVETVVHKGESKVALSMEDYQRLIRWHSSQNGPNPMMNGNAEVVVNGNVSHYGQTPATTAESAYANPFANSHGQIRPSTIPDTRYVDASALMLGTGQPQHFDPSTFSPESIRRMKHMENTIQDALANSPESVKRMSSSPTSNVLHEALVSGDPKSNYQLNSAELQQLDYVRIAFACMDEPLDLHTKAAAHLAKTDHNPVDIMNIMDITMRRFVKMAKKLPTFNDLSQHGKLALLKAAMIDMLTIRGVTRLDSEKQCWKTPVVGSANVSCDMFDKLNNSEQKMRFLHFCKALHEKLRKNDVSINLIGLIVLFDHSRANVDDKDKISARKHHEMYYNLLKRYVESVYGDEAPSVLATVPEALRELRTVSSNAATLFLGRVKPGETEQLPTEFFKTTVEEAQPSTSGVASGAQTSSADGNSAKQAGMEAATEGQ